MDSSGIESGGQNPERSQYIDQIVAKDHQAFSDWVSQQAQLPRLNFTPEASRYVIPRRLLELATEPAHVSVRVLEATPDTFDFLVVETFPSPISDQRALAEYIQAYERFFSSIVAGESVQKPPIPEDIDPYHVYYNEYIDRGILHLNDKLLLNISIDRADPTELFVGAYQGRTDQEGKGIARSFYERLREIARTLGFQYITGENSEENIGYFVTQLGRKRFAELPSPLQEEFENNHPDVDLELFTVDFLQPENPTS